MKYFLVITLVLISEAALSAQNPTGPCSGTFQIVPIPTVLPIGGGVACGAGGLTVDQSYYRSFDLVNDYGVCEETYVKCVTTAFETAPDPAIGTMPIRIRLIVDVNGGDPDNFSYVVGTNVAATPDPSNVGMLMVYEEEFLVPQLTNEIFTFILGTGVVDPDGLGANSNLLQCMTTYGSNAKLVAEIYTPEDGTETNNSLLMGLTNIAATGEIGTSYICSHDSCGLATPTPLESIGFPDNRYIMDLVLGIGQDQDQDGIPDDCDIDLTAGPDCNSNGIDDTCEFSAATDCNSNGVLDECDILLGIEDDCDSDGIIDSCQITFEDCNSNGLIDLCEILADGSLDCDSNGFIDDCETDFQDCNQNGMIDICEILAGSADDCDSNDLIDSCEVASGTADDCDFSGVPDVCEFLQGDCDNNGVLDLCELVAGSAIDCDDNGVLDNCDISNGSAEDCNSNNFIDSCEVVNGSIADCNGNFVPDICEYSAATDCNSNGLLDSCDLLLGVSQDCDGNQNPDECDLSTGVPDADADGLIDVCDEDFDFDADGIPNNCDVDQIMGADCDTNGQLDFCQTDTDSDGVIDPCDADIDGDGIANSCDVDQTSGSDCDMNGQDDICQIDTDGDGTIDLCDDDIDGDGVPNSCEIDLPEQSKPSPNVNYSMYFDTSEIGSSGSSIQIRCMLDNPGGDIAGWFFAVCEDTANNDYDFTNATSGQAAMTANGGSPAVFDEITVCPGEGIIQGVVVDFVGINSLPASTGNEMMVIDVDLLGSEYTYSSVEYCNAILCTGGSAPTETLVVPPGGGAPIIPEQVPGLIKIGDINDCNSNGILDVCEIDLGAEDSNANGVLDMCEETSFIRADVNGDSVINIADAIAALAYLFTGGGIDCEKAGDSNDDGDVNIADGIQILGYLFSGTGDPPAPFPDCGWDPTTDSLGCEIFEVCP